MRYGQIVMGPAGSGKSRYCSIMQQHAENNNKRLEIVNLDPAAEYFDYECSVDIRELIQVDDVMEAEDTKFGPNGALIFCMQYLLDNISWLIKELGDIEDDYVIFDCPGQIELYTHMKVMSQIIEVLQKMNFRLCSAFIIDSQFMIDEAKFLSGTMIALSVMMNIELPHINILTKVDLLSKTARNNLDKYLIPDERALINQIESNPWNNKYRSLTTVFANLINDYSVVRYFPLNIEDDESVGDIKVIMDGLIQYGEDAEVKTKDFEAENDDD